VVTPVAYLGGGSYRGIYILNTVYFMLGGAARLHATTYRRGKRQIEILKTDRLN